jgi:tRNA pseudouridine38-40 synthase
MHKYQILIEYVGTNYRGWQIQKKGQTIQGVLQDKISKLLKEKVIIIGSGRTDAGVHAIAQSAHFESKNLIENRNKFLKSINYFLNNTQISIIDLIKKKSKFHARFSAKQRLYRYIILNRSSPSPLYENKIWHIINKLDLNLMKKAAKKLVGTKDFSTFRASSCAAKTPIRTIKSIKIKMDKEKIFFDFKSKSFLQQQVRSMVGCLKYVGEKKWDLKEFIQVIESKNRKFCAPPAPAKGLYLSKIIY